MEILRILADKDDVLGAKTIALGLKKKGYDLGERAVRYHMRILDEKGFTERKGYAGRKITPKGLKELEKGLIYDQVDFIFSKFENMIYNTTLDPNQAWGNVVVNTSIFREKKGVMDILKEVFTKGIAVSPYVRLTSEKDENDEEYFKLDTICGTTIDGMLRKVGIPVIPQYGGLVEVDDYTPIRFTELIAYKKTSMTPLEAFTDREMTSVLEVVREGTGYIPVHQPFELGWMDEHELVRADAKVVCKRITYKFHAAQGVSRVEPLHRVPGEVNEQAARDGDDARLGKPLVDQQQVDGIRAAAEGFFGFGAQEQPDLDVLIQLQPGCGRGDGGGGRAAGRREGRPDIRG